MKQRKCPYKGELCHSYGDCQDCEWNKLIEKTNKKCTMKLIKPKTPFNEYDTERHYTCSRCKKRLETTVNCHYKYCPYCGAKIKEFTKENEKQ